MLYESQKLAQNKCANILVEIHAFTVLTSLGFSCVAPAGALFCAKPDIVFETGKCLPAAAVEEAPFRMGSDDFLSIFLATTFSHTVWLPMFEHEFFCCSDILLSPARLKISNLPIEKYYALREILTLTGGHCSLGASPDPRLFVVAGFDLGGHSICLEGGHRVCRLRWRRRGVLVVDGLAAASARGL